MKLYMSELMNANALSKAEDEQNACDWDNPVEAKDGGLYDYNDGVITC